MRNKMIRMIALLLSLVYCVSGFSCFAEAVEPAVVLYEESQASLPEAEIVQQTEVPAPQPTPMPTPVEETVLPEQTDGIDSVEETMPVETVLTTSIPEAEGGVIVESTDAPDAEGTDTTEAPQEFIPELEELVTCMPEAEISVQPSELPAETPEATEPAEEAPALVPDMSMLMMMTAAQAPAPEFQITDGHLTAYAGTGGAVVIPDEVRVIAASAFSGRADITDVKMSDSVLAVEAYAFENCVSLLNVELSKNLESIGDGAFRMCSALQNIYLPASINAIGSDVFAECPELVAIVEDGSYAQKWCAENAVNTNMTGGEEAADPEPDVLSQEASSEGSEPAEISVAYNTQIENECAIITAYLGSDENVIIPSELEGRTVSAIGEGAFANCSGVKSVEIPETVTSIAANVFNGCTALERIRIPASVASIAELDSLVVASPSVVIELSYGSYAEQYCTERGIAFTWFDYVAPVLPEAIIPAKASVAMGLKESVSVAGWTLLPEGAQDTISYASKSTKIATVTEAGIVTAKRVGSTSIVLMGTNGIQAEVQVTVKKEPSSVSISAPRTVLGAGEQMQLGYTLSKGSEGSVSFTSQNPEIATVTAEGLITAIAPGSATIQAKTYNGRVKTGVLTVKAAPAEITPARSEVKIGAQDSWVLGYSLNEGAAGSAKYASNNEAVATVDADGRIHAHAEGETEISITTYNGISTACKVTVVPVPTAIELRAGRTSIGIKETLQLQPVIAPEGTQGTISYKSSKASVASVDGNGVVTAKKAGTVTITATTYNGLSGTIQVTVRKAPSSVSISAPRTVLGAGEQMQLGYTLSKGSEGSVSFTSQNPEIATVTAEGLITAVAPGSATIQAKTYNGRIKTGVLTVKAAPAEITPARSEVKIGAQDSWVLGYSLNEGAAGSAKYASNNEAVATVDADGRIHAHAEGETEISITTYNGISTACKVTVVPAPTAIELRAGRTSIGIKETLQLQPVIAPEGTQGTISYKSSKASVASVDGNGVVTAKKAGTVTITATTYNGLTATIQITIRKAPSSVSISAPRTVLGAGEQMQLGYTLSKGSEGSVSFTSQNPEIATVTAEGLITAVAPGSATIQAKTYNGRVKTGVLTVKTAPAEITPARSEVKIGAQDSWVLGYSLNEGAAGAAKYASNNEAVATVDADGRIHAHAEGEAEISITTYNGISTACKVTVVPAPTAIELKASRTSIGIKETLQLQPVIAPEGTQGTISYKSSKASVASVDGNGVVTAKKAGTVTITATTYNGLTATIQITIRKAPSSVSISAPRTVLGVGEQMQLGYTLSKGSEGSVSFTSQNPEIATVTAEGLITAVAPGSATIQAKTYNGRVKTGVLTVKAAPAEITPARSEVKIGAQDSWVLGYSLNEGAAGSAKYASNNEAVATVDADGRIHAHAEGDAEISITTYNGISTACKVTVVPAPTAIELRAGRTSIGIKETLQLQPVIAPEGTQGTIAYKSSKASVASVDGNGVVTAKKAGTVTITATTYNGLTATIQITIRKAPSSVSISAPRTVLGVGEQMQLGYTLSKGSEGSVSFTSQNPEIATVTAEGLITAVAPGSATIQAKTYNGRIKTGVLTVKAAPAEITPARSEVKIGAQDSWVLAYSLNEGAAGSAKYASNNEAVATVDADGRIHAHAEGEAEISITTYNGVSTACKVTVVPAPTAIELKASRTSIGIKETLQLQPVIAPEGTQGTIAYKSSKASVASVDGNGVVTAKKAGTVTITATTYNGLTATIQITIRKAPSGVSISAPRTVLGAGEQMQLGYTLSKGSEGSVSFTSRNPEIATVTAEGLITAVAPGSATIQAKTYNGRVKTGVLTVKAAPAEITPARSEVKIGAQDSWVLGYSLNEGAAGAAKYASNNEAVATVDADGRIHAHAEGEAEISITTYNGISTACKVTVVPAPTAIELESASAVIGVKEQLQLVPLVTPDGTVGTMTYASSKSSVASVSKDGLVTAKKAGTANISVTTYNGLSTSMQITVRKAPSSVTLQAARRTLGVGEKLQLGYTLSKGSAGEVRFESMNPDVLSVSTTGEMTAIGVGVATVRATTFNGKTRTMEIRVANAPEAVFLNADVRSIGVGDGWTIGYSLNEGAAGAVTFASSDASVAEVDASGRIVARSIGTADISANAYNGIKAICKLTVVPAPAGIDLSSLRTSIGVNEKLQLVPKLVPEGTAGSLSFKSSKTSIATVSGDGVVTARKAGTTIITISTYNGVSAKLTLKVEKAPTGVKIGVDRKQFGVGEEMQFTASVSGGSGAVSFTSGNPAVLQIDTASGWARALSAGVVTVSAKTFNGKESSVEVNIVDAPKQISISPGKAVIGAGDSVSVRAFLNDGAVGSYRYSSDTPEIASVDAQSGFVLTHEQGTAVIRATAYNGVTATMEIQVIAPPEHLYLEGLQANEAGIYEISLIRGESFAIQPVLGEYTSIGCSYNVANSALKIDGNGKVTAQRGGTCTVTVTAYSGAKAVIHVHVKRMLDQYPDVRAVMHAMGAIDGKYYSNSRDAFLLNYAKGNRMFEVDLQYTKDGELVLWHSWSSNRINSKVKSGYIPATEQEFASMQVFDKYDSMTYRDLLRLMDEYPDVRFFIDNKKTASADVQKQFTKMVSVAKEMGLEHTLDRMVIMIYSKSMYSIVSSIYPFSNYILMGYKYFGDAPSTASVKAAMEFCVQNGIEFISMWDYWWKPGFMELANEYGLDVNLHTINSADKAREYVLQGVKLISTDTLSVSIL